jgi:hypothetical protein
MLRNALLPNGSPAFMNGMWVQPCDVAQVVENNQVLLSRILEIRRAKNLTVDPDVYHYDLSSVVPAAS